MLRGDGILTSEVRHTRLVSHLRKVESASIDELAELFGVSKMTIHRDLDRLEAQKNRSQIERWSDPIAFDGV